MGDKKIQNGRKGKTGGLSLLPCIEKETMLSFLYEECVELPFLFNFLSGMSLLSRGNNGEVRTCERW